MNVDWNVMYNARFCGGINVQIVESAEGEVGVEGRGITIVCGTINGHTQIDGKFSIQSFHCPGCETGCLDILEMQIIFLNTPSNP